MTVVRTLDLGDENLLDIGELTKFETSECFIFSGVSENYVQRFNLR